MRTELFSKFLRMSIGWHDNVRNNPSSLGLVLSLAVNDVGSLIGSLVGIYLEAGSLIITSLAISFYATWELSLVGIFCFPFMIYSGYV